jgi:hypothetical protein
LNRSLPYRSATCFLPKQDASTLHILVARRAFWLLSVKVVSEYQCWNSFLAVEGTRRRCGRAGILAGARGRQGSRNDWWWNQSSESLQPDRHVRATRTSRFKQWFGLRTVMLNSFQCPEVVIELSNDEGAFVTDGVASILRSTASTWVRKKAQ